VSGDVVEDEPSDAETIDSESSDDEVFSVSSDDVSDTETGTDDAGFMPSSVKQENCSTSEAATSDWEVIGTKPEGLVGDGDNVIHSSCIPLETLDVSGYAHESVPPRDAAGIDHGSSEDEALSTDDVILVDSDASNYSSSLGKERSTGTDDLAVLPTSVKVENLSTEEVDGVSNIDADFEASCNAKHSQKVGILPKSHQAAGRQNFSGVAANSDGVPNSARNSWITGAKCLTEISRKVSHMPNGQQLEPEVARHSRPAVAELLESYAISAERGRAQGSSASFDIALPRSSGVTGGCTSASVDAAVVKVLESYAVSAQRANIEKAGTSFETAVTDDSTIVSDGTTAGSVSIGSSLKLSDVSLTADFDRSVMGGSYLYGSMTHNTSTTFTACSVKSQCVVPTLCESVVTSTSLTPKPRQIPRSSRSAAVEVLESYAVSAKKVNKDSSRTLFGSGVTDGSATLSDAATAGSCSTGLAQKPNDVSFTAELDRSISIRSQLHGSMQHSMIQNRLPASITCSAKSRRIVPTPCGSVGTSASSVKGPLDTVLSRSSERLMDKIFAVPQLSDNVPDHSSLSSVDRHHDSTYTEAGAGQSMLHTFAVSDMSKHHRSIDVTPSLGKFVVIPDLAPPASDKNRKFGAVTPTKQRELSSASKQPLHRLSRDVPRVDEVRLPRRLLTPQLASVHQQAAATKKSGSDQGPCSTANAALADVSDQTANGSHLDHRKMSCGKDTTYCAASESLSSEVESSAKVVRRRHLTSISTSVTKDWVIASGIEVDPPPPVLLEASSLTKVDRSGQLLNCRKSTAPSSYQCTPVASRQFNVSNYKDVEPSSVQWAALNLGCIDSNNNNTREGQNISDVDLFGMGMEETGVVQKSLPRCLRGFATSSPLPDTSPPQPPDASFCSLSSISLASDREEFDTAIETDDDAELEDKNSVVVVDDDSVILLDVAFAEESFPELSSAASPSPTMSKPRDSSHGSCRKFRRRFFQPKTSANFSTTTFSNPQGHVKTRLSEQTNNLGLVVRSVINKRTHIDVLSSSDSDDRSLTRQNSRSVRNTRVRSSPTTSEVSCCAGPSRCTKTICFRCRCDLSLDNER